MSSQSEAIGEPRRVLRGVILGYLRSKARSYPNVALVRILAENTQGDNLVGRRVVVTDKHGNRYVGRIIGTHGSKSEVVKVRFKPNIPGQLINAIVTIE